MSIRWSSIGTRCAVAVMLCIMATSAAQSRECISGLLGPVRTNPLLLDDGVIVSGSSVESYASWGAWIERSSDNGSTWTTSGPITLPKLRAAAQMPAGDRSGDPIGIIQPSVILLGEKLLRFYARSSAQIARICVADSYDEGVTWSNARPLDLPNPNSGIDLVRLKDSRIILIDNDTKSGRTPLNLAVSKGGEHFTNFAVLESAPGACSYPAIIQGTDGALHITYTYKRKKSGTSCTRFRVFHSNYSGSN